MVFFLTGGSVIWVMSAISVLAAGAGGIALGTLDAELFPTEVRSTSNAMLSVVGVLGSVLGLRHRGHRSPIRSAGSDARSRSPGSASARGRVFVVPRLPESAARDLDDVSPSRLEGYGPDP